MLPPPLVVLFRFTPRLFMGAVLVFPLYRQCLYQPERLPQSVQPLAVGPDKVAQGRFCCDKRR